METQNEQKANEIVDKFYGNFVPFHAHSKAFEECAKAKNAVLDAMEWKEKQLINSVVDFISRSFYIGISNHIISKEEYYTLTELIRDIEQAMEGK